MLVVDSAHFVHFQCFLFYVQRPVFKQTNLRALCCLMIKISIHPHKGLLIIKCDLHLGPFLGSSTRSSSVGSASARGEGEDGPTCLRFLSMISGGRSSLDWREKVKLLFLAITTSPFWGSNGGKYFSPPSALLALLCSIKFLLCFSSTASVTWKQMSRSN